jgi:hypothetical protein
MTLTNISADIRTQAIQLWETGNEAANSIAAELGLTTAQVIAIVNEPRDNKAAVLPFGANKEIDSIIDFENAHEVNEKTTIPASRFLRAGLQHMDDRADTYDSPNGERSMGKTVACFNILTGLNMTEEQGCLFMGLLKKARSTQGAFRADNYEDEAAYAGLRGECASRDRS